MELGGLLGSYRLSRTTLGHQYSSNRLNNARPGAANHTAPSSQSRMSPTTLKTEHELTTHGIPGTPSPTSDHLEYVNFFGVRS